MGTAKLGCKVAPSDSAFLTRIEEAKARGLLLWKYTFSPTRDLDLAGVNVNSIREQLLKGGEILKANPLVKGKDALQFEFLVAARETPSDLAAWEARGVAVQPAEEEQARSLALLTGGPSSGETEHNPFLAPSRIVRVDLKRLDDLMRITGEMVIHRSRLDAQLSRVNGGAGRVEAYAAGRRDHVNELNRSN